MSSGADSEAASQGMGTPSPPPSATIKTPGTKTSMGPNSIPSSPANNMKEKTGEYLNLGPLYFFLVFRRKDLCEAKHDLGVRKMCSKSTLYPLRYAFGDGGGKA